MSFGLGVLGLGMVLVLAGVKGYSVIELLRGNYGKTAANKSLTTVGSSSGSGTTASTPAGSSQSTGTNRIGGAQ